MYIYVWICDLQSWQVILENRIWRVLENGCILLYESCWLSVLTRAHLSNNFKKILLNLCIISGFKTEMIQMRYWCMCIVNFHILLQRLWRFSWQFLTHFFFSENKSIAIFSFLPLLSPCELHYSLIGAGPPSILKKLFYFGLSKAS